MRVIFLTTSFPLRKEHASGVFVRRLATALAQQVELTVVTPAGREPAEQAPYRLCPVRYAPRRWQRLAHSGGGIPDALRRLDPKLILLLTLIPALFIRTWREARNADLVHGHWSIPSVIGALAAKLAGQAAVATLRGDDVTRAKSSRLFRLLLALCVRLNNRTICVSETMTQTLRKMFPDNAEKIIFIPNGVETGNFGHRNRIHAPIHLISVGSCIERKRHDLILQAIADPRIKDSFNLCIVGGGPLLPWLQKKSGSLGIADHVEFTGELPPEKALSRLRKADAFVLASKSEGRPNALMEAMAYGLPVIASDIDGVRELVEGGYGQTFPEGQTDTLVQCLLELLTNPTDAIHMGQRAQKRITDLGLTWENCAERYRIAYESLL